MAEEYNLIEERKRAEEQRKKDREEFEKRLNDLAARRDERMPSVDQIFLNENQIKDYQSRLTTNLDKREELRDYLLGLLFKSQKTQDPEVNPSTGDVTYTEGRRIKPITANTLANEAKQEDRRGKSKIGNFFRNIDYSLSDYKTRDMGVGANQQRQAMQLLDNLLKDQGTEIGRSINTQNTFAAKNAQINQKTDKDAADVALRTRALDQKDVAQGFGDVLRGIQVQGVQDMNKKKGALMDSQTEGQNLRNKFFAPYGSREYQDAFQLEKAANGGKDPDPAKVEERMNKSLLMKGLINMASKGGGSGSTRVSNNVRWSKDSQGREVAIPYTTSSQSTPGNNAGRGLLEEMAREKGLLNLRTPRTQMNGAPQVPQAQEQERPQMGGPTPQAQMNPMGASPIEAGVRAAQQAVPSMKAPRAVEKALSNVKDERKRTFLAEQAINYGLDAKQIAQDAKDQEIGKRFTIDYNPRVRQGEEGTGSDKTQDARAAKESYLTDINIFTNSLMKAAADGTLEKTLGMGGNWGDKIVSAAKTVNPLKSVFGITFNDSRDPTYDLKRIFPSGNWEDTDVKDFAIQYKKMISSLTATKQKQDTGLAAHVAEMENILATLPKTSDAPEVALTTMLTFAISERMKGYLTKTKGYSVEEADKLYGMVGDYIAPRVKMLSQKVLSAKARYANGEITNRADVAKEFSIADLDPDDIIGRAMEEKGIQFSKNLPISIRRLTPKENEPPMPQQQQRSQGPMVPPVGAPNTTKEVILQLLLDNGVMFSQDKLKRKLVNR